MRHADSEKLLGYEIDPNRQLGEIVLQVADDHVNPVGTFIPVIHGGKTGIHVIVRMEIDRSRRTRSWCAQVAV